MGEHSYYLVYVYIVVDQHTAVVLRHDQQKSTILACKYIIQ